jgi:hypothetical protein
MIKNMKEAKAIRDKWFNGPLDVHGGAFDRGMADSYYRRPRNPHKWPNGTYNGTAVRGGDLSDEEMEAYEDGYDLNEWQGDHKDWM